MSEIAMKNNNVEIEDDDIDPAELIDVQENKPRITHDDENTNSVEPKSSTQRRIPLKQVSKLTEDEKSYLIDLYRKGEEDELYKVYFYRNGTHKIVKKKQPPKYNTAKRMLEAQKPTMTNEQILLEHVIDLETKFATLYQKHKKLKKNYKSLHEDIYCDDDYDDKPNNKQEQQPENNQIDEPKQDVNEPVEQEVLTAPPTTNSPQSYIKSFDLTDSRKEYINRIRRPQKGYRRMMESMC